MRRDAAWEAMSLESRPARVSSRTALTTQKVAVRRYPGGCAAQWAQAAPWDRKILLRRPGSSLGRCSKE
jgi:hypothetical protein